MDSAQNRVSIRLFGQPTVQVSGKPLPPLRTRKGFGLLALLALRYGRDVERNWLAGTLWADSDEPQALYNLRRSLSDLRRALGDAAECLTAPTPHTLRLNLPPDAIDVVGFDAAVKRGDSASLDKAIDLYGGTLLEGITEEWVLSEAAARERAYLAALETQARRALEAAHWEQAEDLARKAIVTDVQAEGAWRLLLVSLARQGKLAALTLTYRELRLRLLDDFNLAPDPQTVALFEQLRAESHSAKPSGSPAGGKRNPSGAAAPLPDTLPRLRTCLVGRDAQVAAVQEVLRSSRLVTLTGSGGVGKTRLALAAAQELRADFTNAVLFVDMAAIREPSLVPLQVAQALNVREEEGCSPEETLCRWFGARPFLLILDNCEHLLQSCADLAERLLDGTDGLTLLATSRIALGLAGETVWRVPSLDVPPASGLPAHPLTPDHLMHFAAVQLFVERARQHRAEFRLDAENAAHVGDICRRLDGIPLALELAAARVRHLGVGEIARRMEHTVGLLTDGKRTELPRWQTLHASIEWSWSLLSEREQTVLAALSVFAGGFMLDAAEAVCAGLPFQTDTGNSAETGITSAEVVDILGALIDHSLVVYPDAQGKDRYRLLEIIRQYASSRLNAAGLESTVRARHLAWCCGLAERSEGQARNAGQAATLARLEQEQDNFRAAFQWCGSGAGDVRQWLLAAGCLWWFWYVRGVYHEGRTHLEAALSHPNAPNFPKEQADALSAAGNLAVVQGDLDAARQRMEQCLAIRETLGDRQGMGAASANLGIVADKQQDWTTAQWWYERALTFARESGDVNRICAALNGLACVAAKQQELARAQTLFEEILRLAEAQGNDGGVMISRINLASVAEDRGDAEQARQQYRQALAIAHQLGDKRSTATLLEALSRLALMLKPDEADKTAQLMGAAAVLREQIGIPVPAEQCPKYEQTRRILTERLGAEAFENALAEGYGLEPDAVMTLALML